MTDEKKALDRRQFLRRSAVTAAAAAWAAPVIQSVAASPAFAQTQGSASKCFHSIDTAEGKLNGCMETCQGAFDAANAGGNGGQCNHNICGPGCSLPENECPASYCDSACYSVQQTGTKNGHPVYTVTFSC